MFKKPGFWHKKTRPPPQILHSQSGGDSWVRSSSTVWANLTIDEQYSPLGDFPVTCPV